MPNEPTLPETPSPSLFPPTLWTVVHEATSSEPDRARTALGELCLMYREPARAWLIRTGTPADEAEDLIQSFIADLLRRNPFDGYVRGTSKFRSYVVECLKRFRRDAWRKQQAAKRGAGTSTVPFDDHDPGCTDRMDHSLDSEFAWHVHRRACHRIRERFERSGRVERFDVLRPLILGATAGESYEALGERLGLKVGAVKKAVFDLRNDYYEAFRAEVLAITAAQDTWIKEMRYLIGLLASAPSGAL